MNIQMRHDVITLYNYSYPWWWQGLLGSQRAKQPPRQRSVFSVGIFSYLRGAAAHADVAVVLYKALMICKSITTQVWMESTNEILWMSLRTGRRKS